jgi:CRISPR/Cas system CSM-associated protein Csm2 small subunit
MTKINVSRKLFKYKNSIKNKKHENRQKNILLEEI